MGDPGPALPPYPTPKFSPPEAIYCPKCEKDGVKSELVYADTGYISVIFECPKCGSHFRKAFGD